NLIAIDDSLSSLAPGSRRRNAAALASNSVDWRCVGEIISTSEPGLNSAACRAAIAATVDLPDCREQLRSTCDAVVRNTRCCHGSGLKLRTCCAKQTGSKACRIA